MTEYTKYYNTIKNHGGLILEATSDLIIWVNKERTQKRAYYFDYVSGQFQGFQKLSM